MSVNSRLGIIDWGIGGISIYKLMKERRGDVPITYFSDTGVTPYGKMNRAELISRLNAVIEFLRSKDVTHLVIACNAASTAIPFVDRQGLKIEGVIEPAVTMTLRTKPKRLGLIGGRRTVLSGVYRRAFGAHNIHVEQRIAQPLSGLIESGDIASEKLRAECRRILAPLKNCSHILLACTHYPAIQGILRDFVSAETRFIDPASALVNRIKFSKAGCKSGDIFLTSGDPSAMKRSAKAAFDVSISDVEVVRI
ncbi:MAG TPA: aspartate/glutamate racemase family protein [Pyrinomonadaceae bacterium]|nr:aspartate/glutamate racemase family protein [Pyrinomonadaceae bacterium]